MDDTSYPSVITDEPEWNLHWQMSNADKLAISGILSRLKPSVIIEAGCYKGGSLQDISHYSKKVYSLDIDPGVKELVARFDRVDFRIGSSRETLPELVSEINANHETVEFVLLDGNHTAEGVMADINALQNCRSISAL